MASEGVLTLLLRANLAGGAAILAVLGLRLAVRRLFGPEAAYRLWVLPPLAAAAALVAPKVSAWAAAHPGPELTVAMVDQAMAVWSLGVLAVALGFWVAQAAFLRAARAGRAGPAVVGVLRPRLVMPKNLSLYSAEEGILIRAHERQHIARGDLVAGAVLVALQGLCWFNPLVHLAARLARLDQEFACDAAVIRRYPRARAAYARALLKTQLAATPLPLGCYWPSRGRHPLEVRIGLLKPGSPSDSVAGKVSSYPCQWWPATADRL